MRRVLRDIDILWLLDCRSMQCRQEKRLIRGYVSTRRLICGLWECVNSLLNTLPQPQHIDRSIGRRSEFSKLIKCILFTITAPSHTIQKTRLTRMCVTKLVHSTYAKTIGGGYWMVLAWEAAASRTWNGTKLCSDKNHNNNNLQCNGEEGS